MYHRKELATAHYQWEHRMLFNDVQKLFLQTMAEDNNISITEVLRRILGKEMGRYKTFTTYVIKPEDLAYKTMVSDN